MNTLFQFERFLISQIILYNICFLLSVNTAYGQLYFQITPGVWEKPNFIKDNGNGILRTDNYKNNFGIQLNYGYRLSKVQLGAYGIASTWNIKSYTNLNPSQITNYYASRISVGPALGYLFDLDSVHRFQITSAFLLTNAYNTSDDIPYRLFGNSFILRLDHSIKLFKSPHFDFIYGIVVEYQKDYFNTHIHWQDRLQLQTGQFYFYEKGILFHFHAGIGVQLL